MDRISLPKRLTLKIGNLDLGETPLLLSPMENVTDTTFRLLCRKFGADMVYSEFVSADSLVLSVNKTFQKLEISEGERPTAIQVYGKTVDTIVEAAKIIETANPDIIDINCGCPVKKIANKGGGAALLKDIPKMLDIAKAVVKAVNVPVTLKTRVGWDDSTKDIVNIAEQLQDTGIQALAIHGRTREQLYTGRADWELISKVVNNPRMRIPIIGNGDITTPEQAKEAFDKYGVAAVMIGRAAIGRPWVFREMRTFLDTGKHMPALSLKEQVDILKIQINDAVDWLDEKKGILHSRRHLAVSPAFCDLPDFRNHRIAMLRTNKLDELMNYLDFIVEKYSN